MWRFDIKTKVWTPVYTPGKGVGPDMLKPWPSARYSNCVVCFLPFLLLLLIACLFVCLPFSSCGEHLSSLLFLIVTRASSQGAFDGRYFWMYGGFGWDIYPSNSHTHLPPHTQFSHAVYILFPTTHTQNTDSS